MMLGRKKSWLKTNYQIINQGAMSLMKESTPANANSAISITRKTIQINVIF